MKTDVPADSGNMNVAATGVMMSVWMVASGGTVTRVTTEGAAVLYTVRTVATTGESVGVPDRLPENVTTTLDAHGTVKRWPAAEMGTVGARSVKASSNVCDEYSVTSAQFRDEYRRVVPQHLVEGAVRQLQDITMWLPTTALKPICQRT